MTRPKTSVGREGGGQTFLRLLQLLVLGAVVAAIVTGAASVLNDRVRRWWWLVLVVGIVASLAEVFTPPGAKASPAVWKPDTAHLGRVESSYPTAPASPVQRDQARGMVQDRPGAEPSATRPGAEFDTIPAGSVRRAAQLSSSGPPSVAGSRTHATGRAPVDQRNAPGVSRRASEVAMGIWKSEVLWYPKSSHSDAEHEDAWAIDDSSGRVAVADGASSAFMAREWARVLTRQYLDYPLQPSHRSLVRWVDQATTQWSGESGEADQAASSASGQWWAEESGKRGSFATFLGLSIELGEAALVDGSADMSYSAVAVGDTCLVHLSQANGQWNLISSFPIDDSGAFGRHPDLVASTGARPDGGHPAIRSVSGQLRSGDVLLLMTDALSAAALSADANQSGEFGWNSLVSVGQDDFADLVRGARSVGAIEDDDTTLVRIRI